MAIKTRSSSLLTNLGVIFKKMIMTSKESLTSRKEDIISRNSIFVLILILFGSFLIIAFLIASV